MSDNNNTPADDTTYTCHVWDASTGKVIKRKTYKTLQGAGKYAITTSRLAPVREVSIIDSDDRKVAVYKNGAAVDIRTPDAAPAKPAAKKTPAKPAAKKTPATDVPTTWAEALAMTDSALERAFKAGRPVLPLPMTESEINDLSLFDCTYARFLSGARQTGPSGPRYGLTTPQQKKARARLRKRIGKMAAQHDAPATMPAPRKNTGRAGKAAAA